VELAEKPSPVNKRELIDQLDRASLSALLNTAEGNGQRQGKQRAKFFDDARGSAFECAACLDSSVAKKLSNIGRIQSGKDLLERIVAMLSKLVERFDPDSYRVRERENAVGDAEPIEDEDDKPAGGQRL
jgi:four helix bundle protein